VAFLRLRATPKSDSLGPVFCPCCEKQISKPVSQYYVAAITIPGAITSLALFVTNKFLSIRFLSPLEKITFYGAAAIIFVVAALAILYYIFPLSKINKQDQA